MSEIVEQYMRICRGWIVSFSDFRQSGLWGSLIDQYGGAWIRTGAWVKTSPMPQLTGDRPSTGHEDIVIGHVTGKSMEWNAKGRPCTWRGGRDAGYGEEPHPNQKPAWLLQSLIGMFAPRPRMECSCGYSISVDDLPTMSETVSSDPRPRDALQQEVQHHLHGTESAGHEGFCDKREGLQTNPHAGSSDGEPRRLPDGAPPRDVTAPRAPATHERGGTSSQREQARQSDRESSSARQASARRASKAARLQAQMPPLWRGDSGVWSCPCCRSALVERGAIILDPFMGSGTTAIGALAETRLEGEVAFETTCKACAKKLLEQYHPPLPVGARVVGVEGAQKYIDLSIARIREQTPALAA